MVYFQLYLLIGIVYTFYVYDEFSAGVLDQMIKQDPSLASRYSREFYITAKSVSLLLVFAWPLQLIEVLIRSINNK